LGIEEDLDSDDVRRVAEVKKLRRLKKTQDKAKESLAFPLDFHCFPFFEWILFNFYQFDKFSEFIQVSNTVFLNLSCTKLDKIEKT
jgi:hypothetical protein